MIKSLLDNGANRNLLYKTTLWTPIDLVYDSYRKTEIAEIIFNYNPADKVEMIGANTN